MIMLKRNVDWDAITKQQKYNAFLICNRSYTQRQVIDQYKNYLGLKLSFEALGHCINRTAHSVYWEHGMAGGKLLYLCNEDLEELAIEIRERALTSTVFDTKTVLDEENVLRNLRGKKKHWKFSNYLDVINFM